ncbi:7TM chemoreceptor [Oesophagostomum dentatum]|uniref:7TM chemoreceptor n=1 Tax=Oesophagostomum dentatum TaxID=61180 RepID=A0A0B1TBI0_OESDE|nr:7TM chemoreceptor [Oesophagostomum dentatum]
MHAPALISAIIHTFITVTGIFTNGILFYLVITQTPKTYRTYSILILFSALCDFLCCSSELFTQARMIPGEMGFFFIYHGPCRFLGPSMCHAGKAVRQQQVRALRFLSEREGTFELKIVYTRAHDSDAEVRQRIAEAFQYSVNDECVSGNLNILSVPVSVVLLHMTVTIVPAYTIILFLRRSIVRKLSELHAMSESTRQLHSQFLKAITYQACIPIFYSTTVFAYALGQSNIIHHPFLEYSSLICAGSIPVLTPMASLYFIYPYLLVVKKTPKIIRTYSILILNGAVCDLLMCLGELFLQQRYDYETME